MAISFITDVPNDLCFTVSNVEWKIEHFFRYYNHLPSPRAFISNMIKVINEQLCISLLHEPPEHLKTICANILDEWDENLKPSIEEKIQVSIIKFIFH